MSRHEEPVTWKQTCEPHWLVTPPTAHEVKNLASDRNHVTNLPTGLVCPADDDSERNYRTKGPRAGDDDDDDADTTQRMDHLGGEPIDACKAPSDRRI